VHKKINFLEKVKELHGQRGRIVKQLQRHSSTLPATQLDPRADTLPIIGEMCSFLYGSNRLLARIVETGCPLSNWTKKYEERDLTAAMSEQWQFTH
jgi:hypothetical protein